MLSVTGLTLHFGGRTIFEDISFLINRSDRIGLTGRNGAGKSTLLKTLIGEYKQDSGNISFPKECTIQYLAQDLKSISDKNVLDETATAFHEINELKEALAKIPTLSLNACSRLIPYPYLLRPYCLLAVIEYSAL